MQRLLLLWLFAMAYVARISAQYPNSPIMGWKMEANSGHYTFTPATIFGAPNFHYDIYPPEKGSDDVAGWLSSKVEKDIQVAGYSLVPGQSKAQDVKSFKLYSVLVKDAAGKNWLLNYMAYSRPDHSIRFGRITEVPNAAVTKNNMNTAVQHFIKLSKQEGGLSESSGSSGGTGATGNTGAGSKNGSSGSTGAGAGSSTGTPSGTGNSGPAETPVTAPGQGLQPDAIKGMVIHMEYGIGVGGMMIIEYRPYLLLNDGTAYKHCEVSPYDLDVPRCRQVEPKNWGVWKLEGKTLVMTMNDDHKPDRWDKNWFWAPPAAKNEKMSGTWSTISGGGNTALGGGSIVVSSNQLTFNNQGQFTTLSTGGGSYSGATGSVTAYSNKDGAGTYIFDGYSLELRYNNGKVVRKSFCFYPDSKDVWEWGTRAYTQASSNKKK